MNWNLYCYSLPFHPPFTKREGLIIELQLANGLKGWGEIAPLPGRSKETLSQAKTQILSLLNNQETGPLFPSVKLGWEFATRITALCNRALPIAGLIWGSAETILEKAEKIYASGYRTIKVKISNLTFDDARVVLKKLAPRFRVRVDVNRAWSFEESNSFFSHFDESTFAFIEEPTHEIDKLKHFSHPFALDESLLDIPLDTLTTFPKLTALVIKPTILGGKSDCTSLLSIAQKNGLEVIFSSACESGLGLIQIATLANDLNATIEPLGLDTYKFIEQDLLITPLDFSTPNLVLPSSISLKTHLLQKIAHG